MTEQQKSLGQKLKIHLKKSGMTMRELASRVGVTDVSISRYVNDQRIPKKDVLERIAEVLGVSFDELAVGIDLDMAGTIGSECSEIIISDDVVYETMVDTVLGYRSRWNEKQKMYLINLLSS